MVLAEADALAAQEGKAQEAGALYKKVGLVGMGFYSVVCCEGLQTCTFL